MTAGLARLHHDRKTKIDWRASLSQLAVRVRWRRYSLEPRLHHNDLLTTNARDVILGLFWFVTSCWKRSHHDRDSEMDLHAWILFLQLIVSRAKLHPFGYKWKKMKHFVIIEIVSTFRKSSPFPTHSKHLKNPPRTHLSPKLSHTSIRLRSIQRCCHARCSRV